MNGISRRVVVTVVAALAVAATLFVVFAWTGDPPAPGQDRRAPASPGEPAAEGWRWESYGGVEVQVPQDWTHGATGTPPCLRSDQSDTPGQPYVGRPGIVPTIGCGGMLVPPLERRTSYLWFDSRAEAGVREHDGGWVEETRVVAGLSLTVLSDDAALRTRILDTIRPAGGGADGGCPAEHPMVRSPDARPDPGPGGLGSVGPVESATLCRYALTDPAPATASRVLSTSELTGEAARPVVQAIMAAPEGNGPDDPDNCLPELAHGDEALLLIVRGGARDQDVIVRYSGCVGHGFDDGHTHRQLTTDALKPLLSGPHQPTTLQGPVADLVWR